jgi:hypothetical protein
MNHPVAIHNLLQRAAWIGLLLAERLRLFVGDPTHCQRAERSPS